MFSREIVLSSLLLYSISRMLLNYFNNCFRIWGSKKSDEI